MKRTVSISVIISVVMLIPFMPGWTAPYYVDINGIGGTPSDALDCPGIITQPFRSIQRARDEIRKMGKKGATVYIRKGVYFLSEPLVFDDPDKDSGSEGSPNVYTAYNGEDVRIVGGVDLQPEWFKPVTDQNILNRIISETARNAVLEVDLKEHLGDIDYGNFVRRGPWGSPDQMSLELFIDQDRMQIARWPNKDDAEPYAYHDGAGFSVSGVINPDSTGLYMAKKDQLYNGLYYYKHVAQEWYMWRSSDGSTCYISDILGGGIGPGDAFWTTHVYNIKYSMQFLPQGTASGEVTVDGNAFYYKEERPALWTEASDIWTQASWNHLWHDDIIQIEHIEVNNKIIVLKDIPGYGIIVNVDRPYYVLNLLEEINVPGEWYLDREKGNLYLYPPESFNDDTEVIISLLDDYLLKLEGVHHILFKNITFEINRNSLILISETSHDNMIDACVLRNAGMSGILLHGSHNGIQRSEIYNVGEHAVNIKGGDRISLGPSQNVVQNCDIHHWGQWIRTNQCGVISPYTAETRTKNCGHIISHNSFHDAPHQAILLLGNDHVIEYNEIYNVCQEVADAGAIYFGYDWGGRGNIVRYNFIHHINTVFTSGHEVIGLYLDDAFSSIHAYGNIIYDVGGMGIANCGGRDNMYQNNLIIKTKYAFMASDRIRAFRDGNFAESLLQRLNMVSYQSDVWQKAYPECAAIPNDLAIINGDGYDSPWWHSEGCVFSNNAGWDNRYFIRERMYNNKNETDYYKEVSNNNDALEPLFGEELCWNRELRPELLKVPEVPGFQSIPFKAIGIVDRFDPGSDPEPLKPEDTLPDKIELTCYNNVFNPIKGERALIVVELPNQAHIKLGLYNTRGNRIRELADEEKETGRHKYYWNGKNDSGNMIGSGLYFVHIQAGDYKKTKKIVVVK